jgi:hypothetical protein
MHCEGKLKLRSHIASYCLIEVATKAGLTVLLNQTHIHKEWIAKDLDIYLHGTQT